MKIVSSILKCLFWILIITLLAAPIGLIYQISNREKMEYVVPTPPIFVETAYGSIAVSERMDMKDSVSVTGVFQSFSYEYIDLKQKDPSQIRWNISVGDEIQIGQSLGTYRGEPIVAKCSGLVTEIQVYTNSPYIKIQMAVPVVLVCDVSQSTLMSLKYAKELSTLDGENAKLSYIANIRNSDGSTRIHLQIESDNYFLNQAVEDMYLYTGNEYLQTLVLPKECLYQKVPGEEEPWFVRQVTSDGVFIAEVEVGRGYSDNEFVSVTGITVGQFFDAGYGQIAKGGDTE